MLVPSVEGLSHASGGGQPSLVDAICSQESVKPVFSLRELGIYLTSLNVPFHWSNEDNESSFGEMLL